VKLAFRSTPSDDTPNTQNRSDDKKRNGKLTQVCHDMPQLSRTDVPVAILIKDLESLLDLLLAIRVLHLPGHHGEELREIDRAVTIGVDLVDHVTQLGFGRVLAKGAHDGTEFAGGDRAISVFLKQSPWSDERPWGGELCRLLSSAIKSHLYPKCRTCR
jgi:hypothetical protein